MRDFHAPEPELPEDPGSNFMTAAVIGVGCMGMLAGGIVIGLFAGAEISVALYAVLLPVQFVVTQSCIWRFNRRAQQWLKTLEGLS